LPIHSSEATSPFSRSTQTYLNFRPGKTGISAQGMVSMKSVSNITMPAGLWTFTLGFVADIISPGRNSLDATFTILSSDRYLVSAYRLID
jgi:hypothetical protein